MLMILGAPGLKKKSIFKGNVQFSCASVYMTTTSGPSIRSVFLPDFHLFNFFNQELEFAIISFILMILLFDLGIIL